MQDQVVKVSWSEIDAAIRSTVPQIFGDGCPDILVPVVRGGLVPGVIYSHLLGQESVSPLFIDRLGNGSLRGQIRKLPVDLDILIVDDICTTGTTMSIAYDAVLRFQPKRIRCAACVRKTPRIDADAAMQRKRILTYAPLERSGWIEFPWETR